MNTRNGLPDFRWQVCFDSVGASDIKNWPRVSAMGRYRLWADNESWTVTDVGDSKWPEIASGAGGKSGAEEWYLTTVQGDEKDECMPSSLRMTMNTETQKYLLTDRSDFR